MEATTDLVEVYLGGTLIASSSDNWRVLETSHPPTYYLPRSAFVEGSLQPAEGSTFCEWKGRAAYFDVHAGEVVATRAAWTYPTPIPAFAEIAHTIALMPGRMERCVVNGEVVVPQPGEYYGGWITSRVVGPFKGGPGSHGW